MVHPTQQDASPTRPGSLLGTEVRRVEDPELITGASTYVDDLRIPGTLHAVFVRSPLAHAEIASLDVAEAAAAPGVVAVLTAEDLGTDALPQFAKASDDVERAVLAHGRVRFVGDPVALVVAETRAQAVDAAELVDVDYDALPAVAGIEAALAPDAPRVHDDAPGNLGRTRAEGDGSALAGAATVVRLRMENNRLATAPIEGHAVLALPGAHEGHAADLTVWIGTQQPHGARKQIATATGLEPERVRVVAPHVGGGFGGKAGASPDHLAVIRAARHLDRPIAWSETRSEAMLSMQGRGQVQWAELGLDAEGRFTGLRATVLGHAGAYAGFAGGFAAGPTYLMSTGCYRIPAVDWSGAAVIDNTSPVGAFRGAGRPEAAAMIERLVDHAAAETGIAPEELRRRNFVTDFPHETPTGATYDTGDYDRALTEALRIAGIEDLRAEQAARRERGDVLQLGIGISAYVEITGFGGSEVGSVEVHPDGSATLSSGTSAHGQGHATTFSMIVSERLGIPLERLTYVQSDTARVRSGGGTGGSRSVQLGGSAVKAAADALHDRAREIAATMLEVDPGDVVVDGDGFGVAGVPGVRVDWPALAAHAHEVHGGLEVTLDERQEGATFPFGAHVSVVEVDTETGRVRPLRHIAVDDCGRVLNPLLVAGQQHGGLAQGISQALWEQFVHDEDGIPMTSTFADYAMPTAADLVAFEASTIETPTPLNALGAKGIGESATVGSTPAVQNAVVDALRHLGVRHVDLPCTPHRVHAAILAASRGVSGAEWTEPPTL